LSSSMKRLPCSAALALATALGLGNHAHAQTPALPTEAIKAYCAAAGDSMPAVFGGIRAPAVVWRCVHGVPYVCQAGADGVACSARSRSRVPLPSMVESCRDYGYLPVSSGAFGYVWDWVCRNGTPVIAGPQGNLWTKPTMPEKFDTQGYAESEWQALTEVRQ
jgi:hypothetical protein